jgi:nucleoside-diphosphate-sugar epimerase
MSPTRTLGFIGATGMLGLPVAQAFVRAGWRVKALVRNPEKASKILPPEVELIVGDLRQLEALKKVCTAVDAIYLNLSVDPKSSQKDFQPEQEGLLNIIEVCRQTAVPRIIYLSSIAQRYQGMNGFSWWVFALKQAAIWRIQESGIPYLIFLPSNFMETIPHKFQMGRILLLTGQGRQLNYYIAAVDYANQVVRALEISAYNKQYVVQGLEGFTPLQALETYRKHHFEKRLLIVRAPLLLFYWLGKFNRQASYGAQIIEALNEYPETFEAEATWTDLGKPQITLSEFAQAKR